MTARGGAVELWAGVECTVNRVGDRYFDQLERTGHHHRLADLDLIAGLGVRTVRYPVLWERTAPGGLASADFTWPDARLGRLRALGVRPIVGLVHHGSGPPETSLLDPAFPEGLAAFARAVAERYPTIDAYTPVNEPLTTARFSGLYGHWYPHRRDHQSFVRALLHQCRAIALAMRAIRQVNPAAILVQTEDLGTISSTPELAYQAAYENERRWLSFDLLCGRVGPRHPLYEDLLRSGATRAELERFVEEPCPPDILGLNYYVTSDRFLDGRLDLYPAHARGGNGRHAYVDVEAVRVAHDGLSGHKAALLAAHERYGRPVAITEAHLSGPREEQLRWLLAAWRGAEAARAQGVDVRAVTAWSLFGAVDWDSLVARDRGHYEPGVFDIRAPSPRPTALVRLGRALAEGRADHHPLAPTPGWWQRDDRFLHPKRLVLGSPPAEPRGGAGEPRLARPVLITGKTGMLGSALARVCRLRGLDACLLDRRAMDITDPGAVARVLARERPWAVINAAGFSRVDAAEGDEARVYRENLRGPEILAEACRERGIPLVTFSSDLVFDGAKTSPYLESDAVAPLGVYGRSQALAERRVLELCPEALIVRTAALFGAGDPHGFVAAALAAFREGRAFHAAADTIVSPTYVPSLADATLDLLIDGERGRWHLTNRGALTWAELAERSAHLAGIEPRSLVPCPGAALGLRARRPRYSALSSERGILLPPLDEALARHIAERQERDERSARPSEPEGPLTAPGSPHTP